jgi:hypothetical protein
MECSTWALLQAVMPCVQPAPLSELTQPNPTHSIQNTHFFSSARKTEPPPQLSARALLSSNPYTPTSVLAQATMASSRTLSELVVVREWLHDTAPPPPRPDASTGYWRFTKHRVTQGLRMGNAGRAAENVVREMDPDAVVREAQIGRSLAGDDAVRETFHVYGPVDSNKSSTFRIFHPHRATIRLCRTRYLRMSALGTSRTPSSCVVMHTNRGARRAYAAPFSSHGPQFVSLFVLLRGSHHLRLTRCVYISSSTA